MAASQRLENCASRTTIASIAWTIGVAGRLEVVGEDGKHDGLVVRGRHVARERSDVAHRARLRARVAFGRGAPHPERQRSVSSGHGQGQLKGAAQAGVAADVSERPHERVSRHVVVA